MSTLTRARPLAAASLPAGLAEYMSARTDRSGDCWIWTGATNGNGYGRFVYDGIHIYAHRAALAFAVGEIPPGMVACHSCDNPPCVNPDHLRVGTMKDNVRDMHERGRARIVSIAGEDHFAATVPGRAIAEAVRLYLSGVGTQASHAADLGVAQSAFGRWVRGEGRHDSGVIGVSIGKSRRPGVALKPCGTRAAYERHRRNGESCADCRCGTTT